MKQNLRRAVNLTALVLATGLLIGLFTGCQQNRPPAVGPHGSNESSQPNGPVQPTDPSIFRTDGNGVITGYTCYEEDLPKVLVIPAKIGEEVITGIGWSAFKDCTSLTELKLPASLTKIGSSAFSGCTGLTSIDLSACTSLTQIGGRAFFKCEGLTEVKLPASLTEIGGGAFEGCTGLTSLDLSACTSLTAISGFSDCTSLTEVKLPASLTKISQGAFEGCTGLTSAVFADKNDWKVYNNYNYSDIPTDIQLNNTATAAWYLREAYADKYWKKN